jgi:NAD(P)-dependent dehydrogenase (short-subunit alcohol dehydrogenase family)
VNYIQKSGGVTPPPDSSIYSAIKDAVDNIAISHCKEFGARKIRVHSLNPGIIETEAQ